MKRSLFTIAAAALFVAGCSHDQPDSEISDSRDVTKAQQTAAVMAGDNATLVADAKLAVSALGKTLKTQLQSAIETGGVSSAVEVCHQIAPAVAKSLSKEHEMALTRVSLKNRNPEMGVPNAWQAQVLEDFETRRAAGQTPETLTYSEVVDGEFRFMKAIPTAAVCLNCHGADIKPEVQDQLTKLYPKDRAVGYQEGELRGAFVAVKKLAPGA